VRTSIILFYNTLERVRFISNKLGGLRKTRIKEVSETDVLCIITLLKHLAGLGAAMESRK